MSRASKMLGLTEESLADLGIGWWARHDGLWLGSDYGLGVQMGYTFPMRSSEGEVVGIRLRLTHSKAIAVNDTNKMSLPGSTSGLFIPSSIGQEPTIATLFVVEGPTDTAAMRSVGHMTVGRPSNSGGHMDLLLLAKRLNPEKVIALIDRDEPTFRYSPSDTNLARYWTPPSDGSPPLLNMAQRSSLAAAEKLFKSLHPLPCLVSMAPEGIKDAREWIQYGATGRDVRSHCLANPIMSRGF